MNIQKLNSLKKYLPFLLLGLGVVILISVFLLIRGGGKTETDNSTTTLLDLPLSERPFVSLIPRDDGHWLKLKVEKFKVKGAKSMDYELLYKLPDGRPDVGVPGTIKLDGVDKIERDLLLGSESSGKFRYDEGVSEGTVTVKFRNDKGKLIARYSSSFHLQSKTKILTSIESGFSFELDKLPSKGYFVTMGTIGVPGKSLDNLIAGPFAVFPSSGSYTGVIKMAGSGFQWQNGNWIKLDSGKASDTGVFASIAE